MNPSEQTPRQPEQLISESDIESRDLKRRSFLKGLGIFAGISALGLTAAACKDDPTSNGSDPVDDDPTDGADTD